MPSIIRSALGEVLGHNGLLTDDVACPQLRPQLDELGVQVVGATKHHQVQFHRLRASCETFAERVPGRRAVSRIARRRIARGRKSRANNSAPMYSAWKRLGVNGRKRIASRPARHETGFHESTPLPNGRCPGGDCTASGKRKPRTDLPRAGRWIVLPTTPPSTMREALHTAPSPSIGVRRFEIDRDVGANLSAPEEAPATVDPERGIRAKDRAGLRSPRPQKGDTLPQ